MSNQRVENGVLHLCYRAGSRMGNVEPGLDVRYLRASSFECDHRQLSTIQELVQELKRPAWPWLRYRPRYHWKQAQNSNSPDLLPIDPACSVVLLREYERQSVPGRCRQSQ